MQNGQKTISELFDGRKIFNIPKYQRAYAWEEQQLKDFVEDIENHDPDPDKNYFFGTILLQEQPRHEGFEMIDIVDGQQRITTLVICMKLLLAQHKEADNEVRFLEDTYIQFHGRYKLHVLEIDNDFFTTYILQDNPCSDSQVSTPSQRRLLDAKAFLNRWIEGNPDKVENFINTIECMKVLTYSVEDNAEATLIFETTNDRGKSLTGLEKTKSFLMHKTYITSETPEDDLATLQNRFSEIYRNYEAIEESEFRMDEDSVLQYHFIAFEEWTPVRSNHEYHRPVQMIKQQVNRLIAEEKNPDAMRFVHRCSRELKESFENVRELLLNPAPYLLDIFALNRPATFYPLLIKTYKSDNLDGKPNFIRVAKLVEIICFRFGIGGHRANKGSKTFYRLAKDFEGDFNRIIKDLQDYVDGNCTDADFRRSLESPFFYSQVSATDQRYLFWKYENHLRATEQPIFPEMPYDEFTNEAPRLKFSIEHIIPQNPKDSKVVADESLLQIVTSDFLEDHLHSIGNLTIDPQSANSSKSNQDFERKDQGYFQKAPLKTQNEVSDFRNPETGQWDEVSIRKRAEKILKFALKHWNLQNV